MKILFIGSDAALQSMSNFVDGGVLISKNHTDPVLQIYEVNSIDTLYKIPRTFNTSTFFYITTDDKSVLNRIKEYSVNGIFFPTMSKDAFLNKILNTSSSKPVSRSPEEYETMRIKIMAKAESIPPLPDIATELIRLTRSDTTTISQLTEKIKKDQSISTTVVKLVNSPFYALRQEINSIDRATALLGFNTIKNIALAISINKYFNKRFSMYNTDGKTMWLHSYTVACISKELANILNYDQDTLYLAGLLHDIGKIVLVDFLVKPVQFIEDEKSQLGFDHAEVGANILKSWSISTDVYEAVKLHHEFETNQFGKIIYYANRLANLKDNFEETIDEIGIVLGISDINKFKNKITLLLEGADGQFTD